MFKTKRQRKIAILVSLVFLITVIVYPLLYGTDPQPANEPPVELELNR